MPPLLKILKAIAQTGDEYKNLVAEKIEITQRASSEIKYVHRFYFMALLSAFQVLMKMEKSYQEKN